MRIFLEVTYTPTRDVAILYAPSVARDRSPPSPFAVSAFLMEESDGGHRIKRALYIGIKRLCMLPHKEILGPFY